VPPRRQSKPRSRDHAALGEAITLLRAERGLSQEQLADAAHLHLTHIGGMERGTNNPSYETLLKLARALGTTPGALLTTADELRRR
jgi:transcriptional regulator with XRE-family HTH domain